MDRLANGGGSLVAIECATFNANLSALAGGLQVKLATRVRLLDRTLHAGAQWNFKAQETSADAMYAAILRELISPSGATCSSMPPSLTQIGAGLPTQRLKAAFTPASTDEGGEMTLRATFDNPAARYPAVSVSWGDGTTHEFAAGESRTLITTHRFVKDGRAPVSLVVRDTGSFTYQLNPVVNNVAPVATWLETDPLPAREGDLVTLRGGFVDPGSEDKHTVRVTWGDGSVEVHNVEAGARRFSVQHRYRDDQNAQVSVVVSDELAAGAGRSYPAVAINVAPSILSFAAKRAVTPAGQVPVVEATAGVEVIYGLEFSDPGTIDTHTVTVDWGDGTKTTAAAAAGARRVELPHRYAAGGTKTIKFAITDDDGASASTIVPVYVRDAP
jgi:hypothetical protein